MSSPALPHIRLDERGVAWIDGTNTKVIEVVLDKLAYGWSPEEMHLQHPHLSLSRIHAAFLYYYDHQVEMDAEIERQRRWVAAMRDTEVQPPSRTELESRLKNA